MEIKLKYGTNPHQKLARIIMEGPNPPLKLLNGAPSFINILDALGAYQLARELYQATGQPGAASFKHVSPAGAAIAKPLSDSFRQSQYMTGNEDYSPVALAYIRARGGDRMCSFGDFIGVSHPVDISLAQFIKKEVSDGIIAPGYDPEALAILKEKKKGGFLVLEMDPNYEPSEMETREIYGIKLEQTRNNAIITPQILKDIVSKKKDIPADVVQSLMVATVALKYTQSNSVGLAYDGQVIGMGAGQQSRVHCTRLACSKADKWLLQQHPKVLALQFKPELGRPEKANVVDGFLLWDELSDCEKEDIYANLLAKPEPLTPQERQDWIKQFTGIVLSSDAFIPFRDNIDRAQRSNVQYVLHAGGSLRDEDVTAAADQYGMVMVHSGLRLFLH
jgi:phosphoribosylaminoimidazolecarboxamide formyltransferase/IMP cyclohydrolase